MPSYNGKDELEDTMNKKRRRTRDWKKWLEAGMWLARIYVLMKSLWSDA